MIVKRAEAERLLAAGAKSTRLALLYGPDEAGSRALADILAKALGPDADRIDLGSAALRSDPARLSDEAGAIALFGGPRYVRIEPAGDEIIEAVVALAETPGGGNPVVAVAGALRKDSKLLKFVAAHPEMIACVSYVPEGADADRLASAIAREAGLMIGPDVARRLAAACHGDRALIAREIEKLALYADAAADRPREIGHDALDALGAAIAEGDMGRLIDAVLEGRLEAFDAALNELAAEGIEGIPLIRALLRRLTLLAQLRAEVAAGNSIASVMASAGKSLFWKEKDAVARQLALWAPPAIARAIHRLIAIERAIKASGTIGPILFEVEAIAIGRQAQRMR